MDQMRTAPRQQLLVAIACSVSGAWASTPTFQPTELEQYMLQTLNRARADGVIFRLAHCILPAEGVAHRTGFKLETIEAGHAAVGKLWCGQMLQIKVNYLSRGGIFGRAGYVNLNTAIGK